MALPSSTVDDLVRKYRRLYQTEQTTIAAINMTIPIAMAALAAVESFGSDEGREEAVLMAEPSLVATGIDWDSDAFVDGV